jgi:hypothetical protein
MIYVCGAVDGMRIGMGNGNKKKKPDEMSFYPPKTPHDLTWDRNWVNAVGA